LRAPFGRHRRTLVFHGRPACSNHPARLSMGNPAPDRILHGVLWHRGVYASPPIPLPARCPTVGTVALPRGWRGGLLSRDDLSRADHVVARSLPYHLGVLGGSLHCLRAGTGGVPPATGVTVHAGGRPHLL